MTETDSTSEADGTGSNEYSVPDQWQDLDPTLIPLLEQPREWFDNIIDAYETAFGQMGQVESFTPEAVTFDVYLRDRPAFVSDLYQKYLANEYQGETRLVLDREEAQSQNEPALWMSRDGNDRLTIKERVPFTQRVTTTDGLEDELLEIMENNPHWENLLSRAASVAEEMEIDQEES